MTGHDMTAERLVLGALVRGSLGLRDVAELSGDMWHPLHVGLVDLVLAALDLHGRVDLALVAGAGRRSDCPELRQLTGGVFVVRDRRGREERVALGYLPTCARQAPARPAALAAVRRIAVAAEDRRTETARRSRREKSTEAQALRRALDAYLAGDAAAAMRAMGHVERMLVGVSGPELAELAGGGAR